MIIQVVSLTLSFLLAWHGRDRVWTPTFEGDQTRRFARAMSHYHEKIGLTDDLVFDFHAKREKGQERWCSSVELTRIEIAGFETQQVVLVRWFGGTKTCDRQKPEYWALHESCHLRMQHHRGGGPLVWMPTAEGEIKLLPSKVDIEAEVETCAGWYSAKERR